MSELTPSPDSIPPRPVPAPVSALVAARSQAGRIRDLVDQGLSAGSPDEMLRCFEAAHRLDLNDATAMSVHGMAIAMVQHRYQQGIVFCEEAVRRSGPSPFLLVNLAKAYLAARNRREAVRALRRALARSGGTDERARAELAALGLRRNPPIPFLPRSFFLNRWLGRLRHSLLERRAREDGAQPLPAELGRLSGDLSAATEAFEQSRTRESDAK